MLILADSGSAARLEEEEVAVSFHRKQLGLVPVVVDAAEKH
jgi:hypothetical protein